MSIQALGRLVIHVAVTAFKLYIGVVVFVMIQQIRVSFEHGWTGGAQISARHSGNELLKPHHKMICISALERQVNRKNMNVPAVRMFLSNMSHQIFAVFERDVALTAVKRLRIVRAIL